MTHILTLPWPPSLNTNVRHTRGAHYLSGAHKAFRDGATGAIYQQIGLPRRPCSRCRVRIDLTPPTRAERDADNHIKPVLDVLVATKVLAGDSAKYIKGVAAEWTDEVGRPGKCEVYIEELL